MPSSNAVNGAFLAGLLTHAGSLRADLAEYLAKPDPSYSWKLTANSDALNATLYESRLISETWQGITWEHNLNVCVPTSAPTDVQAAARGAALLVAESTRCL